MQSIIAEKRDVLGKKVKSLRKQGFLPAVIYGKGKKSQSIAVKEAEFAKLWKLAGESTLVELLLGDDKENVLIQDVLLDPLKDKPIHADFYIVDMERPIKVDVALEFQGESDAVNSGGVLVKVLHSLKIQALPKNLPHSLVANLSLLKNIGDSISVSQIAVPANVEVLVGIDEKVVIIEAPRTEEEIKGEGVSPQASLDNIEVVSKKTKVEGEEEEGRDKAPSPKNE